MKKLMTLVLLFLLFPLVSTSGVSFANEYQLNQGVAIVNISKCSLYTAPSFDSEKILIEGEPVILRYGEEVEVKIVENNFALVNFEENEGYIYKFYLSQNFSQTVYPVFNGKVRVDTVLYDATLNPTEITIKKDSPIFIYEGFSSKKDYTAVQIVLDGNIFNGYIKTQDIKPNGVSGVLIAGITIILAAVTIILSLIFIRKKKQNGQKKKSKKTK